MLAVLQFDSASVPLLDRMADAGRLPTLARLRARAVPEPFETSAGLFEGAVYPTLYSGVDVGEHGLYSALPWVAAEQRVRFMLALSKPETVWERLGRAGRRSLIVDPFQSWPTSSAGVQLNGWQFRNRMVLPFSSSPPSEHAALAKRFGWPPSAETVFGRTSASGMRALRRALIDAPGRAADAVTHLLGREHFDLVWVTFSGAHLAGHYLWDSHATNGSDAAGGAALEDVYAAVDAAMDRIVAALPSNADLLVLSPDGMGPNTSRSDLLPDMLDAVLARNGHGRARVSAGGAVWRMRGAVPAPLRAGIARVVGDSVARGLATRLHFPGVDWRKTRAFALPGDCAGFVRLNLCGRERHGIVQAGDAGALMEEIAAGLATFHDPDGAPAVAAVEPVPPQIGSGRRGHALPDLIVRWSDRPSASLTGVRSPRFGEVARRGAGPGLSGNHVEGAWILVLPGSARVRPLGRRRRLADVAATACALMGTDARGLAGDALLAPA